MATEPPYGYIRPATAVTNPANPTAPSSTSALAMQGLAAILTPVTPSGNVLCIVNATLLDNGTSISNGIILQLYVGPVISGTAPPANAGAIPGSAVALGPQVQWETPTALTTAASFHQPIQVPGLAKGLTPNAQYWFDVAAESVTTASAVSLSNVSVILVEI